MGDEQVTTPDDTPGALGRRAALGRFGRLAAGGAGVVAGAALLRAEPAGATTGNLQYGATNDAGIDSTVLTGEILGPTLDVSNTAATGQSFAVKAFVGSDDPTSATIWSWGEGATAALVARSGGTGYAAEIDAQFGSSEALHVTGNSTATAVSIYGNNTNHAVGVANSNGNGLLAITHGHAVVGESSGDGHGIAGISHGFGNAVRATATNLGAAIVATSTGTGGVIRAALQNQAAPNAVIVTSNGTGAAIKSTATYGRGAELKGAKAALRLAPNTATTHPTSGLRGDLFVDRTGRLWYCRGGASWTRLA